jgi:histidinol-phosphate aminotransferase
MTNLNRRQWLKTAGITGSVSLFTGLPSLTLANASPAMASPKTDDIIRLSSNENPFGPSQKVRDAMINAFDVACRYPFGYIPELAKMIADKEGLTPDHIVITAGSTEGLKICGQVFGIQRGEIIAADPVYKSLISYAEQFGCYINRVPHTDSMEHDLEEMEKRISQNTQLVFFCNPSNPTGTIVDAKRAEAFCERVSEKAILFSDEAYYDYIAESNYPSMTKLVKKGKNVIVSKTFSKVYGLAGIRIGYLIARPDIAERLIQKRMAGPNMLAIHAAKAALQDKEFYQFSLSENLKARKHLYGTLDELNLRYVPSHTNFVFFHAKRPVNDVINDMVAQGIRVGRPFPPLTDWCRVSTGRMEDMEKLRAGMQKVFS